MTARWRELTSRAAHGVHVRLLWAEPEGRCSVAVTDVTTAEAFQIVVRAGERALDVFHHPDAYAAWHGLRLANCPGSSDPAAASERELLAAYPPRSLEGVASVTTPLCSGRSRFSLTRTMSAYAALDQRCGRIPVQGSGTPRLDEPAEDFAAPRGR